MRFRRTLLFILLVAAAFRLVGLDWDQGHGFHPDERRIVFALEELSFRPLQLNPHFFSYGSFPLYLQKLWTTAAAAIHEPWNGFSGTLVAGRALSALVGIVMVGWLALLGKRLYGSNTGLLAALLLASSVLPIQHAHFITVDLFQALFVVVALERLVAWMAAPEATRRLWTAAAVVGLTLATKVSSAPLLLPLALAPLIGAAGSGAVARIVLAAGTLLVAALFFALGEPYALLDAGAFLHDVREQSAMVRNAGSVPYTIQYLGTRPYLDDLRAAFTWGMGPALGLAAGAGMLLALARGLVARNRAGLLVLAFAVPYLAITGAFPVKFMRYLLPLYPLWCLWAARLLLPAQGWRRPAAVVVVAATFGYALGFAGIYLRPHPWIEGSKWFHESIPAGSRVVRPHWEEGFPVAVRDVPLRPYEHVELPLYDAETDAKLLRLAERLAEGDVVVFPSKRLYGAISNAPERFPRTLRLLELLFAGDLGYRLERVFASRPGLLGAEWNDDLSDESFTVYDHPKTLIFRRSEPMDAVTILERLRSRVPSQRMTREDLLLTGADGASATPALPAGTRSAPLALAAWTATLLALGFCGRRGLALALPNAPPAALGALGPVAGTLAFAWLTWILAATGLAGFTAATALLVLAGLVFAASRLPRSDRFSLAGEAVLLVSFAFFLAVRAGNPEIYWGEKPMDFAFLNALYRATSLPPQEPWLSGTSINYPYFGHFVVAAMGKVAHVAPGLAFNLGIATVAALTASAAFGAGVVLTASVRTGLFAAALVAFAGNLAGPAEMLARRSLDFDYFWATSRVVRDTINEFPLWSFLFADLHAHVMALPLATFLTAVTGAWFLGRRALPAALLALVALALGAIAVTSTWSFPVHAAAISGIALVAALRERRPSRLLLPALAVPASFLPFLPYWFRYEAPPPLWSLESASAPPLRVAMIFGLFLTAMVFALGALARDRGFRRTWSFVALAALISVAFISTRTAMALLAAAALLAAFLERDGATRLAWVLGAGGTLLVAAADTITLWDRMNTIFKLYLEAWLLFALATALWLRRLPGPRGAPLRSVVVLVVVLASAFTAVTDTVATLLTRRVPGPRPTLDGQAYLASLRPGESAAVRWINGNLAGAPVVLEAHGPSYREYGRLSMHTGLPTVLGWEYHLFQRAVPWDEIYARRDDVEAIYAGLDRDRTERLLRRYGVSAVFVGEVERATYPAAGLSKFDAWEDLFQPLYRTAGARLYAVTPNFRWSGPVSAELPEPAAAARRPLPPPPAGRLREPRGIAADADGVFWVADFGHDRVQAFDAGLAPVRALGTDGSGPGEFADPCGIAVGPDGRLYVADTWNHRVQVLERDGTFVAAWGDEFFGPRGIAVAADGSVWVTDTGNGRVARYTAEGERLGHWGGSTGGPELREPVGIAIGSDGRVYVADTGNRRIVVLSPEGEPSGSWSVPGWESGVYREPYLAPLPDGRLAVTDPTGDALLIFSSEGRLLWEHRLAADARPTGVVAVSDGEVVVAELGRHRLTRIPLP